MTDNWAGPPNLFGAYGSDLDYSSDGVFASFAAGKLKATKPAAAPVHHTAAHPAHR